MTTTATGSAVTITQRSTVEQLRARVIDVTDGKVKFQVELPNSLPENITEDFYPDWEALGMDVLAYFCARQALVDVRQQARAAYAKFAKDNEGASHADCCKAAQSAVNVYRPSLPTRERDAAKSAAKALAKLAPDALAAAIGNLPPDQLDAIRKLLLK